MAKKGTGTGKFKEAQGGRSYIKKTTRQMKPYGQLHNHDHEAFEAFFRERSYKKVAVEFGVSDTAVHKHAEKNHWLERLAKRCERIEKASDDKLSERLARDAAKHYDLNSLVQVNAGNILRKPDLRNGGHVHPPYLAMTAGALETSIKTQRLLAGESTEKKELTVKDIFLALAQEKKRREQQVIDVNSEGGGNN